MTMPVEVALPATAAPAMLDIDLAAPAGQALLAALTERRGPMLSVAAHRLSRLFLLRSPWAPGLRFVGGQAVHEGGQDDLCDRRVFSMSGPATEIEDGLAACIGEGIELLSQIERPGDVAREATMTEVRDEVLPTHLELVAMQCVAPGRRTDDRLDWSYARRYRDDSPLLVPADWCLRRAPPRTRLTVPWMLGTGVAAGPDRDAAAARALLELIERDAVAHWWLGGKRGRPMALHSEAALAGAELSAQLRQDQKARLTWLIDITTDIGVPCAAALSVDPNGMGLACGFAARATMAAAVRGALLENAQMELALLLARTRAATALRRPAEDTLTRDDKILQLATQIDATDCDLLYPAGVPREHAVPADGAEHLYLQEALARHGIDAALVDLTRPEFAIPVVRALAPDLQSLPSSFLTPRLLSTLQSAGSADEYTKGLPLL